MNEDTDGVAPDAFHSPPNDQVERRADATPTQKEAMNRHVRSNAPLGRDFDILNRA